MKTQKKLFLRYVFLCLMALCLPAQAETVTWFHNDASGTPLMATDAYGNVLWKENYRPYGERINNPAAGAGNSLWFTGKPFEQTTGLSYMGARYYSPVLGRFMSFDPKGADPEDIQGLNGYVYANNNPYRFVDPDGHSPLDIAFLAYDLGKLGVAIYNGTGVGAAAVDVALSAVGVISPVPGVGEALKGARVAAHGADAVKGVEKAAEISTAVVKKVDSVADRPGGIPNDWLSKGSKRGEGTQYINPNNPHDRVRVMPGNPNSPNPAQQVPYVKRQIDGKFYDASGHQVSGDSPSAHIPLEQFKF